MSDSLKIGLIHLNIAPMDLEINEKNIVDTTRQAALSGHKIIVNTEMAVSGYGFKSQAEIYPYVLSENASIVTSLQTLAKEFEVYIVLGLAFQADRSEAYYNSALVIGPNGETVFRYNKVNAESRWACPGEGTQPNVFDTPWGKVGVMICSDTYHGLLTRQAALKGANLILVPANWPVMGLDPREVWKSRAIENGVYMAICNRCGQDTSLTFDTAPSCVITPSGDYLLDETVNRTSVFSVEIPLTDGRIADDSRLMAMGSRQPENYSPIHLDLRLATYGGSDLTAYHGLPEPAPFTVIGSTRFQEGDAVNKPDGWLNHIEGMIDNVSETSSLVLLPRLPFLTSPGVLKACRKMVKNRPVALCFQGESLSGETLYFISERHGFIPLSRHDKNVGPGPKGTAIVDYGPARIGICFPEELTHPESGVALAKLGCDLVVSSTEKIDDRQYYGMVSRVLDKLAIAVAGENTTFICHPPEGHQRWNESRTNAPETARLDLDIEKIRQKFFQDRVDFDLLLSRK